MQQAAEGRGVTLICSNAAGPELSGRGSGTFSAEVRWLDPVPLPTDPELDTRSYQEGGQDMPRFEPKNPDFREIATATFAAQQAMHTLGISIARLEPGEVDLSMGYSPEFTQQNGFVHAGIITAALDTACGIAAFTLMPKGADILTVEFKTNLLAPAKGERFVFRSAVIKPGRTLTICEARAFAQHQGTEILIATMTGTLMAIMPRA
jgi:uncharacterized protein (TIGR00369 family)